MVRIVWITALMAILCIVLYLPSAFPPERFIEVLRAEHAVHREVWGPVVADRILGRMLDMQQGMPPLSESPAASAQVGQMSAMDAAVAAQVSQMSVRLFGNVYFRSIDSLFALATYRVSAIVEVLPLLSIFLGVVMIDGVVLRRVRAKEFIAHSAEMFGGSVVVAIVLGSVVVVSIFLPSPQHPMFATLCLLAMLFVLSRAVANYHVIR
jgi:Domain of unknown function (DUF4400)